jgi:hypothetical protein
MECLVRQVHGHQVNLETVKVGLKKVFAGVGCVAGMGADYLTDKYTKR